MITTQIEIARPPSEVRKIFFDFENYPSWHGGMIKSIAPLPSSTSDTDPLSPSQKLHCVFEKFVFDAIITENSGTTFQWRGPPVQGVTGLHSFAFEESKVTPGGTTFKHFESFTGFPAFLLQPWLLGKEIKVGFEGFNRDLKKKAEAETSEG
ncbi:hypothetical protein OIDMADRAFT_16196 [Oidiodendron maius Zn]|uniref:Polyketide cyclase/dehydrase n=1 Tax=Oidiodendron maius (strain Zn) TaxID=913774 RepID=A0A0C3HZ78_OIDMZ|nr:hypothetical protein OIDMADRAFT_16196 [Oidiodendron maius Zn]